MQRKARIVHRLVYTRHEARAVALHKAEQEWLEMVSQADNRVNGDFTVRHGKAGEKSTGALLIGLSAAVKNLLRRKDKS